MAHVSDPTQRPGEGAWFNPLAAFLGPAYLRNAFTMGTEQEVAFLVDALGLRAGMRVLDVGCGPGRHSLALARRGMKVVGVDLSPDFIALARNSADAERLDATFEVVDVRDLAYDREFDAAICLCQGGFGLLGGADDELVMERFTGALQPRGRLACSAFSSYFVVRHLEPHDTFDPTTGVNHERASLRDGEGNERDFDLWTTCFTARELRLLAERSGLAVDGVHGVAPGHYGRTPVTLDVPELLLLAYRP
jgi:SAM-dependent methyltransferase